jgi:hypothetical protein
MSNTRLLGIRIDGQMHCIGACNNYCEGQFVGIKQVAFALWIGILQRAPVSALASHCFRIVMCESTVDAARARALWTRGLCTFAECALFESFMSQMLKASHDSQVYVRNGAFVLRMHAPASVCVVV